MLRHPFPAHSMARDYTATSKGMFKTGEKPSSLKWPLFNSLDAKLFIWWDVNG
jgi:hypothetical protein